jgi:hypothetical protein
MRNEIINLLAAGFVCTDWGFGFDADLIAVGGRYASKCIRTKVVHSIRQAGEVLSWKARRFLLHVQLAYCVAQGHLGSLEHIN